MGLIEYCIGLTNNPERMTAGKTIMPEIILIKDCLHNNNKDVKKTSSATMNVSIIPMKDENSS